MKQIYTLIILAIMLSCSDNKVKTEIETINFDFSTVAHQNLSTAGVVNDYNILQLQTPPEVTIGSVDEVVLTDNYCYVADYKHTQAVYIFDKEGNFINKIARQGNSNNEYIQLNSMFVDSIDNTINLQARLPGRILKFTPSGDSLISVTNIERYYTSVHKVADGLIAYKANASQGDSCNIELLTLDGNVLKGWMPITPGWESKSIDIKPLSQSETVYYAEPFKNLIYAYDNREGFIPKMKIKFNNSNLSDEIKSYDDYEKVKGEICHLKQYYETLNNWIFHCIYKGESYFCVYNKQAKTTQVCLPEVDADKYFLSFGKVVGFNNGKLITYVNASDMELYLTGKDEYKDFSEEYSAQIKRLNERLKPVSENDNPLLIIYKLD